jgi:GT2 family glycosyltransferase
MHKNVAILIIFFNKLDQTIECIESFLPSEQNIYVLNNASEAVAWQVLQNRYRKQDQVLFFHSPNNIGPARGRNLLLEKCNEEWIFLVDNDICIRPVDKWKTLFDKKLETEKEAAIFYPLLFNVHEGNYAKPQHFLRHNDVIHIEETDEGIINYFPCCAVIIHKKIFENYGNFDSELFAFEDYEFSIRALCSPQGGFKVFPLPEIELIHDHRFQKKSKDKKTVLERYNEEKIQASMQRIMDKHGIVFEHDWKWWTKKQIADMNGKTFLGKLKHRIANFLGR